MNLIWVCNYDLGTKYPFPNTVTGERMAIKFYRLMKIYHPYRINLVYPDLFL